MMIPWIHKHLEAILWNSTQNPRNAKLHWIIININNIGMNHFIHNCFDRVVNTSVHFDPNSLNQVVLKCHQIANYKYRSRFYQMQNCLIDLLKAVLSLKLIWFRKLVRKTLIVFAKKSRQCLIKISPTYSMLMPMWLKPNMYYSHQYI